MTEIRHRKTAKDFAARRPVGFALIVVTACLLYQIAAEILGYAAGGDSGHVVTAGLVNLIGALICLVVLYRCGWLEAAGVTRLGSWGVWALTLLLIGYDLYFFHKAMFGDAAIQAPRLDLSIAILLRHIAGGGLVEEFVFRGLVLYTFVRVWGDSRTGLLKSVLLSSVIFGAGHAVNLLTGKHYSLVLMQMADTLMAGVVYAALVLFGRSIWPVVVLHAAINATVNLRASVIPGFEETMEMWLALLALQVLPLLVGIILLYRAPLRPVVPEAP